MTDYTEEAEHVREAASATQASAPQLGIHELMAQAAQAEQAAKALRAQAALLAVEIEKARTPQMPDVNDDGPQVVTFTRYMGGREYSYAAVGWRLGRSVRWSVTGQAESRFNWPGLLAFIGEANWSSLALVTDRVLIGPPESQEPPVVEAMGRYGRVQRTTVADRTLGDPFS